MYEPGPYLLILSYFTRGAGALHAKINKTHLEAGALIYIPCLNITVAGALVSKKMKEPSCMGRAYYKPCATDLASSAADNLNLSCHLAYRFETYAFLIIH